MFEQFEKNRPLADTLKIWRYMKVSTLLMMLSGKVFIPTLATLQKIDPTEAILLAELYDDLEEDFAKLLKDSNWYDVNADTEERGILHPSATPGNPSLISRVRINIWLRELAKRRLIWCWNQRETESMAFWKIYGDKGIAITSSPSRVNEVLKIPNFQGSLGKVTYIPRNERRTKFQLFEYLSRPYYFKQESFSFENEVRFVVAIEPTISRKDGHVIDVDYSKLIEEIVISPHLPKSEAEEVSKMIRLLLPSEPRIPVRISEGTERHLGEFALADFPYGLADEILGGDPYEMDANLPDALKFV